MPEPTRRISAERAPLLELDRDLAGALAPERRAAVGNALIVTTYRVGTGRFELGNLGSASAGTIGVLIVDGIIARDVLLGDTTSTELLGAGDLIRSATMEEPVQLLESQVRWSVLSEARVALLGQRLAVELCRYPELYAALIDRLSQRSSRLAVTQAISKLTRVDRRLLALFWHLAERWGRVTTAGVVVRLRLSHRMLGQLVGARRPTISSALAQLAQDGELVRRDDGSWLIAGEPDRVDAEHAERHVEPRRKLLSPVVDEEPSIATDRSQEPAIALSQLHERFDRVLRTTQTRTAALQRSYEAAEQLWVKAGSMRSGAGANGQR